MQEKNKVIKHKETVSYYFVNRNIRFSFRNFTKQLENTSTWINLKFDVLNHTFKTRFKFKYCKNVAVKILTALHGLKLEYYLSSTDSTVTLYQTL